MEEKVSSTGTQPPVAPEVETASTAPDATSATAAADAPQPIPGLVMGRMVYYVLDQPYSAGEAPVIRPAIVVQVWDRYAGTSNLQVITDGENDRKFIGEQRRFPGDTGPGFVWKTSVLYSEGREPGTWHWPPRD
jgi:hypothetical protein